MTTFRLHFESALFHTWLETNIIAQDSKAVEMVKYRIDWTMSHGIYDLGFAFLFKPTGQLWLRARAACPSNCKVGGSIPNSSCQCHWADTETPVAPRMAARISLNHVHTGVNPRLLYKASRLSLKWMRGCTHTHTHCLRNQEMCGNLITSRLPWKLWQH